MKLSKETRNSILMFCIFGGIFLVEVVLGIAICAREGFIFLGIDLFIIYCMVRGDMQGEQ